MRGVVGAGQKEQACERKKGLRAPAQVQVQAKVKKLRPDNHDLGSQAGASAESQI